DKIKRITTERRGFRSLSGEALRIPYHLHEAGIKMFDLNKLSKLRFGMSGVPKIGGQPGTYEEKWSQWFLERSFFRDFLYRNPRGRKKGQELADAVVLFDDVVLMVQVKAQCGKHDPMSWATEKLLEAFRQLCKTHASLVEGHIKKLKNDFYGEIEFDPKRYPNRIGLIILAHDSDPYVAAKLAPEILTAGFPVHVFSLRDFATAASRFDTAGDLITFLELRGDIALKEALFVQDEVGNIARMISHVEEAFRAHMPPTSPEMLQKMAKAFEEVATGKLMESPDWRYGLSIDDMIARVHDVDPGLPWNKGNGRRGMEVARFLGWLTRDRRIKLGKKIISACEAARDGKIHYFPHVQPSRGTACVYLVTSQSRPERVKTLEFLVSYAHMKYGVGRCLGVATEPIGNGRSYDFLVTRTSPPPALLEQLKTFDDPFSSEEPLF
ncbi:MAG: hypothetical protein ACRESF_20300, partial [Pseudomonas sp.]